MLTANLSPGSKILRPSARSLNIWVVVPRVMLCTSAGLVIVCFFKVPFNNIFVNTDVTSANGDEPDLAAFLAEIIDERKAGSCVSCVLLDGPGHRR